MELTKYGKFDKTLESFVSSQTDEGKYVKLYYQFKLIKPLLAILEVQEQ